MSSGRFDYGRGMIALVTPHGSNDGNVVHHASNMRKPIRNRSTTLSVACETSMAGNDRALHLCEVVAEADCINHFASVLVSFRIKGIDVADTPTHEQFKPNRAAQPFFNGLRQVCQCLVREFQKP